MLPDGFITVLMQIPFIAAFMWFLLKWQQATQDVNRETHEKWRKWLEAQNAAATQERDAWRDWLERRDQVWVGELKDITKAMGGLERRIEMNTSILLLVYASLVDSSDKDVGQIVDKYRAILEQSQ